MNFTLLNNSNYDVWKFKMGIFLTDSTPVAVGILSRGVSKPTENDWNAIKQVMRYIKNIRVPNEIWESSTIC